MASKVPVGTRLPGELAEWVDEKVQETGGSRAEVLRRVVEEASKSDEKENGEPELETARRALLEAGAPYGDGCVILTVEDAKSVVANATNRKADVVQSAFLNRLKRQGLLDYQQTWNEVYVTLRTPKAVSSYRGEAD